MKKIIAVLLILSAMFIITSCGAVDNTGKVDYEFNSLVEMKSEYDKNPVAFEQKYSGKTMQITVNCYGTEKNVSNKWVFIPIDIGTWRNLECFYFTSKNSETDKQLSEITRGDTVTITFNYDRIDSDGYFYFKNCSFQKVESK